MNLRMELRTLTPVHVGSGNKLTSTADFVVAGNRVIVVHFERIIANLPRDVPYSEILSGGVGEVLSKYRLNAEDFKRYEMELFGQRRRISAISEHIKQGNKPYIPGSSVKGAIRTAVLWYFLRDNREILHRTLGNLLQKASRMYGSRKKELKKQADDEIQCEIFGKTPHEDIFRALKVSDSSNFRRLQCISVSVLNAPRLPPMFVEGIPAGETASLDISLDECLMKENMKKWSGKVRELEFEEVQEQVNEFSKEMLSAIERRFSSLSNRTRNCIRMLRREVKEAEESGGMVLNIGWGGGFLSKTLGRLLLHEEMFERLRQSLGIGRSPRTRRISENFPKTLRVTERGDLLGWVKLQEMGGD